MQTSLIKISIVLITTLIFSCSTSVAPEEKPPLGDFLIGTYNYADAYWSPNPNRTPRYNTEPTDLTFLSINSSGTYLMRLELYVEQPDTIFNIYQEGSYLTTETEYVESDGLGVDHWKGKLEFRPEGETVWSVDFLIYKNSPAILFQNVNEYLFELPDSGGFIWISKWMQLKLTIILMAN